MVGGEDHVAGKRQFQPAAAADPVDRGDHRLVEIRQFLQPAEPADTVVAVDLVAIGRSLQVPPGAEEFLSSGGQDRHAQFGIVAKPGEHVAHDPAGRQIDGIGFWPVERHF